MRDMHDGRTSPAGMRGMAALSQARSSILPTVLPMATTTGANRASTVGTCRAPEDRAQIEHECQSSAVVLAICSGQRYPSHTRNNELKVYT